MENKDVQNASAVLPSLPDVSSSCNSSLSLPTSSSGASSPPKSSFSPPGSSFSPPGSSFPCSSGDMRFASSSPAAIFNKNAHLEPDMIMQSDCCRLAVHARGRDRPGVSLEFMKSIAQYNDNVDLLDMWQTRIEKMCCLYFHFDVREKGVAIDLIKSMLLTGSFVEFEIDYKIEKLIPNRFESNSSSSVSYSKTKTKSVTGEVRDTKNEVTREDVEKEDNGENGENGERETVVVQILEFKDTISAPLLVTLINVLMKYSAVIQSVTHETIESIDDETYQSIEMRILLPSSLFPLGYQSFWDIITIRKMYEELQRICLNNSSNITLRTDDLAYKPKSKTLVVMGMNETLIEQEMIDEMLYEVGENPHNFDNSAPTSQEILKNKLTALQGQSQSLLSAVLPRLTFTEGAFLVCRALKTMGYKLALITQGFELSAQIVGSQLGFDYVLSNHLEVIDGKLTGGVTGEGIGLDTAHMMDPLRKVDWIQLLTDQDYIQKQDVIVIGDYRSADFLYESCGHHIYFNAGKHKDLRKALYMMGFKKRDVQQFQQLCANMQIHKNPIYCNYNNNSASNLFCFKKKHKISLADTLAMNSQAESCNVYSFYSTCNKNDTFLHNGNENSKSTQMNKKSDPKESNTKKQNENKNKNKNNNKELNKNGNGNQNDTNNININNNKDVSNKNDTGKMKAVIYVLGEPKPDVLLRLLSCLCLFKEVDLKSIHKTSLYQNLFLVFTLLWDAPKNINECGMTATARLAPLSSYPLMSSSPPADVTPSPPPPNVSPPSTPTSTSLFSSSISSNVSTPSANSSSRGSSVLSAFSTIPPPPPPSSFPPSDPSCTSSAGFADSCLSYTSLYSCYAVLKEVVFAATCLGLKVKFDVTRMQNDPHELHYQEAQAADVNACLDGSDAAPRKNSAEIIKSNKYKKNTLRQPYVIVIVQHPTIQPKLLEKMFALLASKQINVEAMERLSAHNLRVLRLHVSMEFVEDKENLKSTLLNCCAEHGADVALQLDDIMKYCRRLVVFDMDSTLIQQEVIDEIAKCAGVEEEVRLVTHQAMCGQLDFYESLKSRVALLKGLDKEKLDAVENKIEFTPGSLKLCSTLRELGYRLAVVSGGFSRFARYVKKKLGLHHAFANSLQIDENGLLTGKVVGPIVTPQRKVSILRMLADLDKCNIEQVIAVGDGANDIPMLLQAGMGVAFCAKPKVQEKAEFRLNTRDLYNLIFLLGVPEQLAMKLERRSRVCSMSE